MTGTTTGQDPIASPVKMSVPTLTAMVVGSMIGAGVFSLPARFGSVAGVYAVKITADRGGGGTGDEPGDARSSRDLVVASLASVYTVFLVFAAGTEYLLVSCVVYFPGTVLYAIARRENAQRLFTALELGVAVLLGAGAVTGVVGLATGWITI